MREFFQKVTHISLSRYILARRIANAAFEIRHSNKSITEIAFEYGFSNLDTFIRAFKRDTGLTPSEFRKSDCLCGRRIICPGVYAPVILGLDNPRFTLPKIREVNELGEMTKTTDSCILYGVPKIFYGPNQYDNLFQLTPFAMCLQSVLNYMGQNISYTQVLAASGAAFRQRWNVNGWDMGASDIRHTYEDPFMPFRLAFKAAGRSHKIYTEGKTANAKDHYLDVIKYEIDCGRPVICIGVVGPPEACIVTGYQNSGESLLGWSLFQGDGPFDEHSKTHETGYFIKDNWLENIYAVITIGEDAGESVQIKNILENALTLMKLERVNTPDGVYLCGQSAYAAWAATIANDANFGECADMITAATSHEEQEMMLWEGRVRAAMYIGSLAEQHSNLAQEFSECAKLFTSASECVKKMQSARGGQGRDEKVLRNFKERQAREQIAAVIFEAAVYERNACAIIESIISKL